MELYFLFLQTHIYKYRIKSLERYENDQIQDLEDESNGLKGEF